MVVQGDEAKLGMAGEIADECESSVSGGDRCEDAYSFQMCLHKALETRGVVVEFF